MVLLPFAPKSVALIFAVTLIISCPQMEESLEPSRLVIDFSGCEIVRIHFNFLIKVILFKH